MSAWQPIETAPRDSKGILGWFPQSRCTFSIVWTSYEDYEGWSSFGGRGDFYGEQPSHWMQVPPPPESA